MQSHKPSLRVEFRKKEHLRVMESASLAEKYPTLKSLMVELTYLTPGGTNQCGHIKYKVNTTNARSVFRFECSNHDCVCGDHDLSAVLEEAVAHRRKLITGETTCQGWRSKLEIDRVRCLRVLRYKLVPGYSARR